ncbi:type II secretion system protein [Pseudorhodoferax sp. Leaf267]|uniref:type II secretion system protein n=1 Tax=Pseudorhodoferax sp. Leaf267 TaxID=1736316 RepID=UPI0006F3E508|nr:prepilin-type N-terminal cleavage/methylation domain-containing protein [Pseudorhodoferax sp. Leaf267]KQP12654.1 type II secretion system protein G [Pseudorhodoferax sp. Leaf267]
MRRLRGFTLVELLVVMAILATLLSIAAPRYFGSVERAKENALRQSLAVMRDGIDKFYGDNGRYPEDLVELVNRRYLRVLPVDPFTDSSESWIFVPPPPGADGRALPGRLYDVRSGAPGKARAGGNLADL